MARFGKNAFRFKFRTHTIQGRQKYLEIRSHVDLAIDFDPTLVLRDDAENRRQTEARSFAGLLGGEKGLKDSREIFRWNAPTGIDHAPSHAPTAFPSRINHPPSG